MKEAKTRKIHYIFLQDDVKEPIITMSKLFRNLAGGDKPRYPVNSSVVGLPGR
jgi:hypothetical protein